MPNMPDVSAYAITSCQHEYDRLGHLVRFMRLSIFSLHSMKRSRRCLKPSADSHPKHAAYAGMSETDKIPLLLWFLFICFSFTLADCRPIDLLAHVCSFLDIRDHFAYARTCWPLHHAASRRNSWPPDLDLYPFCCTLTDAPFAQFAGVRWERADLENCRDITSAALSALAAPRATLRKLCLRNTGGVHDLSAGVAAINMAILESLDLRECAWVTDTTLQHLGTACRGLRSLKLAGCFNVSAAGLSRLGGTRVAQTLEYLDVKHCSMGGGHVHTLCHFASLQHLCLDNTAVNDEMISRPLSSLTRLSAVALSYTAVSDASLQVLRALPLTRLQLIDIDATAVGLRALFTAERTMAPLLRSVSLGGSVVTSDVLRALTTHNRRLTYLKLSRCSKVDGRALAELRPLRSSLQTLKLIRCNIDDKAIAHVSAMRFLHTLTLDDGSGPNHAPFGAGLTDACLQSLASVLSLTGLRVCLTFHNGPHHESGLRHLVSLGQLHRLDLSRCTNLTSARFACVKRLTPLRSLVMEHCPLLRDEAMAAVAELPHLEMVNMYGTSITRRGLAMLKKSASIDFVLLDARKLTSRVNLPGVQLCKNW